MNDLKPCPFCGSEAELLKMPSDHWRVFCPKCGAGTMAYLNTHPTVADAAITLWNARAQTETVCDQSQTELSNLRTALKNAVELLIEQRHNDQRRNSTIEEANKVLGNEQ